MKFCLAVKLFLLQNLATELSSSPSMQQVAPSGLMSGSTSSVPLLARVYLQLGDWQWALSPGLDDDSIQGMLIFRLSLEMYSYLFFV